MIKKWSILFLGVVLLFGSLIYPAPGQAAGSYDAFLSRAVTGASLSELKNGFVPQGITYYPTKNWVLVSYYHPKKAASIISVIDNKTNKQIKKLYLRHASGKNYTDHAGGITISRSNLWVSSGNNVYRIPLSDLISAKNMSFLTFKQTISVYAEGSYILYKNNVLWVGEFVRAGGTGKIVGYKMDAKTDRPAASTPDYIIDTPDRVQGIEVLGTSFVFSRSYGRDNDSYLSYYKNPVGTKPDGYIGAKGKKIPYWNLNKNKRFEKSIKMPSMSEGIVVVGNRLYIVFESGASEYNDSKPPRYKNILKYDY